MLVILKNFVRVSLSTLIAVSVLTLNLSDLLACTSLTMSKDCCHMTNSVKHCCAKKMKITFDERITKTCECTMKESQQRVELYTDIYRTNSYLTSRALGCDTSIKTGYHPELISRFTSEYSPPIKDSKYSYLTNLSLRI